MEIKKGDIVVCTRYVFSMLEIKLPMYELEYSARSVTPSWCMKNIYSVVFPSLCYGVFIGMSYLATGIHHRGRASGYDYEPAYLDEDHRYPVLVIEPIGVSKKRYYEPFRTFEKYIMLEEKK